MRLLNLLWRLLNKIEKKTEKELLQEIENLRSQVEKLKQRKKYGLVWDAEREPEKVVLDCRKKLPILVEDKKKEIKGKDDEPVNLLIEGDNYHSLSVLNYTHKGKVDVIYIDPPYNTLNEKGFIYNDKIVDENDSYRHSKWLSFMEKRLKLAKNLLKNTGSIFISIDDNELFQLKLLCDEIFGEKNFVANFVRKNKAGAGHDSGKVAVEFDYMLCYAKNYSLATFNKEKLDVDLDPKYRYSDDFLDHRGKYYLRDLDYKGNYNETGDYPIKTPDNTEIWPGEKKGKPNTWRWSKSKFEWGVKNDFIVFKKSSGKWKVYIKQYQYVDNNDEKRERVIPYRALVDFSNSTGSKELKKRLNQNIFSYPKPIGLIDFVSDLAMPSENGLLLDFFAGSGTTGEAISKLNISNKHKFILCTNNDNGICEKVCYLRVKESIKEHKNNCLKYYKTDFVETENLDHATDKDKIELTYKAGEMIAIREETFDEVEKDDWWQIFSNGKEATAIYFKEDKSKLQKLVDKLDKMDNKVNLYIFSWGKNEYANEFPEYKNIKVKDIPEPLIDVYKEVANL